RRRPGRSHEPRDDHGRDHRRRRVHLPVVLPREATRPAGRRRQAHLPRLRLADEATGAAGAVPAGPGGSARHLRRAALAVAAGLLLFAGHPPLDLAPAGWVALVPLLALARDVAGEPRPLRAGFGWGLLAGAVFFAALVA